MTLAHEPSASPNPFAQLRALGYPHLVPIVPPDAPVSERSTLSKRVGTDQDARGKVPGIRGRDGAWFSFDWVPHVSDAHDDVRWHAMGAGAGIKTGSGLIALDADTLDQASANLILRTVTEIAGTAPCRVGRAPKALYVFRVEPGESIGYQRIEFGPRGPSADGKPGRLLERLEVLSDGRQFVAAGIHPKTHEPYRWFTKLPAFDRLPPLSPVQLARIFDTLRGVLPSASAVVVEGGGHEVAQEALLGDPAKVAAAVAALPNTSTAFPSRESYLGVGYAIKAAMGDTADALEVWAEWCSRWDGGVNDRDVLEADWRRMKGPFRRGASWLYETAERESGGAWRAADAWFEDLGPAPEGIATGSGADADPGDVYHLATAAEIMARPPVRWLVDRHIPRNSIGFLYSLPGAGKSFLAMDMGLAITEGFADWHGDRIDAGPRPCVVYIVAEGGDGMSQRFAAWRQHNKVETIGPGFRVLEQTINFMKPADVGKLIRSVRAAVAGTGMTPALIVVDTVSRALPGADENGQQDMTLFVTACDAVRTAFKESSVLGIHHTNAAGTRMRGSTVLLGAGDFVFRMEREKGAVLGKLTCEKQKDGEDGWTDRYALAKVLLPDMPVAPGARMAASLTVARLGEAGTEGVAAALGADGKGGTLTEGCLSAMAKAWADGEPWSKSKQAGDRRAVRRMADEFGIVVNESERLLALWETKGWIRHVLHSSKTHRYGFKVLADIGHIVQEKPAVDIFG